MSLKPVPVLKPSQQYPRTVKFITAVVLAAFCVALTAACAALALGSIWGIRVLYLRVLHSF